MMRDSRKKIKTGTSSGIIRISFSVALLGLLLLFHPIRTEAAENDEITVTVDVDISLSYDKSVPTSPKFIGTGKIYGISESAASHGFVSVSFPDSYILTTPEGEVTAPAGTEVTYTGSINARKGRMNYEVKHGLNGRTAGDIGTGEISVSIPFTMDFLDYGEGEYSMKIPVTLTFSKAYGSYTTDLDFTPWDELKRNGKIVVSDGTLSEVTQQDDILEIDPSITTMKSSLFTYTSYTEVAIPSSVTSAAKTFQASKVDTVIFDDDVTVIPKEICYFDQRLVKAVIPDRVTTINSGAFDNCVLLEDFSFPSALTTLGSSAFRKCRKIEEFVIKSDLTVTASYSSVAPFYDTAIKRIIVEEGVTKIPKYLCSDSCQSLTELYLPTTLTEIGPSALTKATSLEELVIRSDITNPSSSSPFKGSGIRKLTFVDGVTEVPKYLFEDGCGSLEELYIPSTVTSIGVYAFRNAKSLKDLTIRNNIEGSQSSSPFSGSAIEHITFTDNVTSIYRYFFANACSNMTELDIPAHITSIGIHAFKGNAVLRKVTIRTDYTPSAGTVAGPFEDTGIEEIIFAEGVTKVGRYFFEGGASKLTSITIPSTLVTIGAGAFKGCKSLAEMDFPAHINHIGPYAFEGASSLKKVTIRSDLTVEDGVVTSPFGSAGIETVVIADGVTEIPRYLFADGVTKMTSLTLPEGLKSIGTRAFFESNSIRHIKFPSTLQSINGHAFADAKSLVELDFPESVTYLGGYAFDNAVSLKKVTIRSDIDVAPYTTPFRNSGVEEVVFTEDVTVIHGYLFDGGCANMVNLAIPQSVGAVNSHAFHGCTSLKELTIRSDITGAKYSPSFGDSGIETLTFEEGVTRIGGYLFMDGCSSLTLLNLPATLTEIGYQAFKGGENITVHFAGTAAQWSAVDLHEWEPYAVVCSDTILSGLSLSPMMQSDMPEILDFGEDDQISNVAGDGETEELPDSEDGILIAETMSEADSLVAPAEEMENDGLSGTDSDPEQGNTETNGDDELTSALSEPDAGNTDENMEDGSTGVSVSEIEIADISGDSDADAEQEAQPIPDDEPESDTEDGIQADDALLFASLMERIEESEDEPDSGDGDSPGDEEPFVMDDAIASKKYDEDGEDDEKS